MNDIEVIEHFRFLVAEFKQKEECFIRAAEYVNDYETPLVRI